MKSISSQFFLFAKVQSNDDLGVAKGTISQQIRPWAGFKTDEFVKEKLEGLT